MAMIRKGSALNGRLRVTMEGSRVQHVHLDPQALRLGADNLAAAFVTAMNEAISTDRTDVIETLHALQANLTERRSEADRQLAELREDLSRTHEQALAQAEENLQHGRLLADWLQDRH